MKTTGSGNGRRTLKLSYPAVIATIVFIVALALITGNRAEAQGRAAQAASAAAYDPSVARTVTFSDAEVSALLPLQGAQAHFVPGNKVQLTYKKNFLKLDIGATNGMPWAERVPEWLNLQQVDPQILYYSHMNGGRVWMKGVPAWFEYKKYDSELSGMPLVVGIETGDGRVTVTYIPQ